MPPLNKAELLRQMEASFEKGQIIFAEGDTSREMYILLSGQIEVRKNNRVIAIVEGKDSYLGEMSTLLGAPRSATLVAAKKCRLIRVGEDKVADFFSHSPTLGIKLATLLAKRLQEMNTKYERMLAEIAPDEDLAQETMDTLTQDISHRSFLRLFTKSVGTEMSIKEIVEATDIPLGDINKVFLHFGMAGMINIHGRQVRFTDARNPSLRHLVMNWVG